MEKNYNQGKIYKIVCNITGEIYIGSTIRTLENRLSKHTQPRKRNCVSRNIIERGDYKIELIKNYPCNSKYELEEEEGKYIRNNTCINTQIPHRTKEEWTEVNKEKLNNQMKKYREDNKQKLQDYHKNNYQEKKETYNKNQKEYYKKNKEELDKKAKEKILCDCGEMVCRSNIARHKRTMKHIKLTECLIID